MTRPDDARRIRGRIRAALRREAASMLRSVAAGYFAPDGTGDWLPFCYREHARLVSALRTGRAIGALTGKTRRTP